METYTSKDNKMHRINICSSLLWIVDPSEDSEVEVTTLNETMSTEGVTADYGMIHPLLIFQYIKGIPICTLLGCAVYHLVCTAQPRGGGKSIQEWGKCLHLQVWGGKNIAHVRM